MLAIHRFARYISCLLVFAIAMLSLPHRPAWSAMAGTESVISSAPLAPSAKHGDADAQRQQIKAFLQRKGVQEIFLSHGISAEEARARIDSLTDHEVAVIADRLDSLPAAGLCDGSACGPPAWFVAFLVILVAGFIFLLIKAIDE